MPPFLSFAYSVPVHAQPYWSLEGTATPVTHSSENMVTHFDVARQEHRNIPIYRLGEHVYRYENHTTLTSVFKPDFKMLAANNGLSYDDVTPPDVQIAAGPKNVMEMINLKGQVWTKDGAAQGTPFALANFYGTGSDFISDPKVLFDDSSGRWFASLTDISESKVFVAVSSNSDATSKFCIYNFTSANFLVPDQPILGVSNDKIAISVNDFDLLSGQFVYSQFWILNKSQMVSCQPISYVSKTTPDYFSIHPVQSMTRTSTQFMISTSQNSSAPIISLFSVRGVPPGKVTVDVSSLEISSLSAPPSAEQPGTNLKVDTGDTRVQDAKWSDDTLWMTFSDGCVPTGDSSQRSCLHFVKLDTENKKVRQDFDYGIAGKYLFYPAIDEVPSNKDLFVVFGYSSQTDYPGIEVTVQKAHDREYAFESPMVVKAGNASMNLIYGCGFDRVCRYGDYFGAAVDPKNPNLVWAAGEYTGVRDPSGLGTGWATEVAKFVVGKYFHPGPGRPD